MGRKGDRSGMDEGEIGEGSLGFYKFFILFYFILFLKFTLRIRLTRGKVCSKS